MKSMAVCDSMFPAFKVANSIFGGEDALEAFDHFLSFEPFFSPGYRSPAIDVREEEKSYEIVAELPGLSEKDLRLEVKDRVLSLSVERKEKEEEKKEAAYIRRERRSFAFERSFSLPENADTEKIEARFKDGLLSVTIQKKPEVAPRLVPVNLA